VKTRVRACCNKETFASEEEARRRLGRIIELGVRRVLPLDVEMCRHGWHLLFPPAEPTPPKKTKPKRSKPKHVPAEVKAILRRRSGGACEVGLICGGSARGVDPAHREGKKAGGTSKPWSDLASNLTWACRPDHDLIDAKAPAGAERLGLKVRAGVARPWEIPLLHSAHGWVLLDDQGGHRPAPVGSYAEGRRPTPVIAVRAWDLMVQAGEFLRAVERYGHLTCPRGGAPREGLFRCTCGSNVFWLDVIA
jgi:hypothetical protein